MAKRHTVTAVSARARAAGIYLHVQPPSYARYKLKYTLYREDRYVGSAETLEAIVRKLEVIERKQGAA